MEGRLWRLLQLAFCLKRQRTLGPFAADRWTMVQREEGLRELMDITGSLPWVLHQVALLLQPATLTLSLLQQSSLHFALMWPFRREAYTDSAQAKVDCAFAGLYFHESLTSFGLFRFLIVMKTSYGRKKS